MSELQTKTKPETGGQVDAGDLDADLLAGLDPLIEDARGELEAMGFM